MKTKTKPELSPQAIEVITDWILSLPDPDPKVPQPPPAPAHVKPRPKKKVVIKRGK